MSDTVQRDKVVYITYVITDDAGQVLEQYGVPVGYVHGGRSGLFDRIEAALAGRRIGDQVEVRLSAEEAFGPHRPELTFTDDLDNVPPEHRVIGAEVEFESERGERRVFRVSRIEYGRLTVDANHPLAGKDLTFRVRVEDIRPATREEVASGMPADSPLQRAH